jgi:hypothetical protein
MMTTASELRNQAKVAHLVSPKPKPIPVGDELAGDQYARLEWKKRIEEGDGVLSSLADAHRQFYNYHRDLREAFERRDPEQTEDGHFMAIKRLGEQTLARAGAASDQARERAEGTVKDIRERLRRELNLTETHRAGEIRTMLRSLADSERMAIIQAAIADRDGQTIAAIVEAPAYLSGMTAEQAKAIRAQYERAHGGDLPARAEALEKAIEINRKTAMQALQFQSALLPIERAREIEARQAAARAMRERLQA